MGLLYVAIARETRVTRLVFTDLPGYWEEPPRLRAMGCHAMTTLQHLDVLSVAELGAEDIFYMGQLRHLTTLRLPALEKVHDCASPPSLLPAMVADGLVLSRLWPTTGAEQFARNVGGKCRSSDPASC